MKNVVIVTHKYLPQPDDDLAMYLSEKRGYRVLYIKHNFSDAPDRRSSLSLYVNQKKTREFKTIDFKFFPELLIYLKEAFCTFIWLMNSKIKWNTYIGIDGLTAYFGLVLRRLGVCHKVIYWKMDFVPHGRFKAVWKNFFYHKINLYVCRNADEVWDLSPRMAEGRRKYFGVRKKDYKCHKVVPYGLWTDRIKKIPYEKCQKQTLVFMGHLLPKQGVDIVLKRTPEIVRKIPNFKFKIIGGGSFQRYLVSLAHELKIEKHCDFWGRIEDSREMEREIAKAIVAIAPYKKTEDNYSYYADPGKVKTYLACGVPVLLTNVPWNAKEIERKKCGLIIKDGGTDLVEKLLFLMRPEINRRFRKNAAEYSKNFNYKEIFLGLFK